MRYANFGIAAAWTILLFSVAALARGDGIPEGNHISATLDGAPGLFHTIDAEAIGRGNFDVVAGYDYTNRDPGRLIVKRIPFAFGGGITDHVTVFASYEVSKSIRSSDIILYHSWPSGTPVPATTPIGARLFNNDAPFVEVPRACGLGDLRVGAAVNLLSQARGKPLALSFAAVVKIYADRSNKAMNAGMVNGSDEGEFTAAVLRRIRRIAAVHVNLGVNIIGDPVARGMILARLQDSFVYRGAAAFPNDSRVQLAAELKGAKYFGAGTLGLNPRCPVDAVLGLLFHPGESFMLGVGYQAHLNRLDRDDALGIVPSGFGGLVAQLTFEKRSPQHPRGTFVPTQP